MKKTTFIFALAVLALFTQCKKQENTESNESGKGIQMVLKADNGGSKTSFGTNGSISWNTNEKIYVVTNGECVGYVTNGSEGGNTFTGTLSGLTASGTYDFHYYYVGNTQVINTEDESFTMDFSNQDGTLAHLGDFHVGYGSQTAVAVDVNETVNTQATMRSLVAMAYFNTAGMAETGEWVYFYGDHINNQLSIDFSTNTPSYGKVNNGWICAGTASSGAYVMLLPNHTDGTEQLATDITFVSKRTAVTCNDFRYGIIGGRFYCHEGNTESPIPVAASYTPGILNGEFSVSATNKVHFSQGNLQYIGSASTPYWKFAENQKDYLGTTTGQNSATETVDRDLFGWGTSGYNHGATCYQPWSTSTNENQYNPYNSTSTNLYDSNGQADWGYNAISNGGNTENSGWRTLKIEEWEYVFNTRAASTVNGTANARYAKAKVAGTQGIILFPDVYTHPNGVAQPIGINNTGNTGWNGNNYTATDFAKMEGSGAVFLSAAGYRNNGTNVIGFNSYCSYWSSSYYRSGSAYYFEIYDTNCDLPSSYYRFYGFAVRLVRNAQ